MSASRTSLRNGRRPRRPVPLWPLLLYYAVIIAAALLLIWRVPDAAHAFNAPIAEGAPVGDIVTGRSSTIAEGAQPFGGPMARLALTAAAAVGALLLALPVAWIHMYTRPLRYDPSLVQSIIILPIVVAGVVLVVKNSLALAFALAGIVAGVRFRQKLNEPQEAVYVLLALGIGLAAGVQALDVALAMSLIFNLVVLGLWRYDLGSLGRGTRPMLATGDARFFVGRSAADRERIGDAIGTRAADMNSHGLLIVHAADPDDAKQALDVCLAGIAEEWRLLDATPDANGLHRLDLLVRLRKDEDPVKLLALIEERWSPQIAAAEYIPHWARNAADGG